MGLISPVRIERITLTAAGAAERRDWPGYFMRIIRSSTPTVVISLQVDSTEGTPFTMGNGEGWTHLPFTRLFFTWAAQAGEWIDVLIRGNPGDADPRRFEWFSKIDATAVTISGNTSVTQSTNPWIVGPGNDPTPSVPKRWEIYNDPGFPWSVAQVATDSFQVKPWERLADAMGVPRAVSQSMTSTTPTAAIARPAPGAVLIHRLRIWADNAGNFAYATINNGGSNVAHASGGTDGMDCFEGVIVPSGHTVYLASTTAGQRVSMSGFIEDL